MTVAGSEKRRPAKPSEARKVRRGEASGVLDRSVAILDAVEDGATSFTAIVEATGFTRTTVHRLIKTLEVHGLLMFNAGYRLGPRLMRLAVSAAQGLPLKDLAHPVLERLSATTGESAQLYIRDGRRRLCVDAVQSSSELRTIVEVGAELPLAAGSAGKVLLAYASGALQREVFDDIESFTDETPNEAALAKDLALIRRRGWAWSSGERQAGVGSVSAPVRDAAGQVIAAVSVSGPDSRIGRISAKSYSQAVLVSAREIGSFLGAPA
jgi:DNA-binding IclR family transcriptional regulator